jgi:hypothetical protein
LRAQLAQLAVMWRAAKLLQCMRQLCVEKAVELGSNASSSSKSSSTEAAMAT